MIVNLTACICFDRDSEIASATSGALRIWARRPRQSLSKAQSTAIRHVMDLNTTNPNRSSRLRASRYCAPLCLRCNWYATEYADRLRSPASECAQEDPRCHILEGKWIRSAIRRYLHFTQGLGFGSQLWYDNFMEPVRSVSDASINVPVTPIPWFSWPRGGQAVSNRKEKMVRWRRSDNSLTYFYTQSCPTQT